MSLLTVTNIDSLHCAPYAALADMDAVLFQSTTSSIAAQALRSRESDLALISLSEFYNHGGYNALAYGLIVSPFDNLLLSNHIDQNLLSNLSYDWLRTTQRPCPIALWAHSIENNGARIASMTSPFFKLGMSAQYSYRRDWAQKHQRSTNEADVDLFFYHYDSIFLDLLFEFTHFGVIAGVFPEDAITILQKSFPHSTQLPISNGNKRISFQVGLQLSLNASIADLGLAVSASQFPIPTPYSSINDSASITPQLLVTEDIHFYEQLLRSQTSLSLSADDIHSIAHYNSLSVEDVLKKLKNAGLTMLNGLGGECLAPTMRSKISLSSLTAHQWLALHQKAHQLGIRSTTIVEANKLLNWHEYLEHLLNLRLLQDQTQGCFILYVSLSNNNPPDIETLLRLYLISNFFMDNIESVSLAGDAISPAMHNFFASFRQCNLGSCRETV